MDLMREAGRRDILKSRFRNGVHSALVRINEELFARKVAAPV
jgi:hypothetical protein